MAFPVTQSFKRTTKSLRFEGDVMSKAEMIAGDDTKFEDGYLVVEKDSHDVYIYDEDATPNQETGRFIKLNTGPAGGDDDIYYITIPLSSLTETDTGYTGTIDSPTWTDVIAELNKNPSPYIVVRLISDPSEPYKYILDIPIASNGTNKNASGGVLTLTTKPEYTVVSLLEDANDKIKVIIKLGDLSGGGSLPAGGTTGQALVKKSNADGDVEWADQTVIVGSDWGVAKAGVVPSVGTSATVSIDISELGLSSVDDYTVNLDIVNGGEIYPAATLRIASRTATSFGIRNTSSTNVYGAVYTVFAKGYGSIPNGGTTGQALVKKSNTDGDVEWKTVSGGGASLTIDTTQVGYGEATISEGGYNLSFTNQNGQGVRIGGISEDGEMVASKTYVDSKSPTIVNEGATFTNAAGNQQMQIRTGGANSVIIKDLSANGLSEYWSYELPAKPYVDTELAKKGNAITTFDDEYKTLQTRDVNDSVELQVVKETSNDYIRVNEYAKDDRGQMQQIFDVNLPTKSYVDSKVGVHMAVGAETRYGTYTDENNVTYQAYTKTIYIPALPSTAGVTTYPMGVTNMKQIISISGVTTDGFVLNAPRQTVSDNITIYQASKGSQTFSIEVGKDRSNKSAYVTIIYAKNN